MRHTLDRLNCVQHNSFRGIAQWGVLPNKIRAPSFHKVGTGFESRPGTLGGFFAELKSDLGKRRAPLQSQCGFTPINHTKNI